MNLDQKIAGCEKRVANCPPRGASTKLKVCEVHEFRVNHSILLYTSKYGTNRLRCRGASCEGGPGLYRIEDGEPLP